MLDGFLFDTLGFAVIPQAVPVDAVDRANAELDSLRLWERVGALGPTDALGRWRETSDDVLRYLCPIGPGHVQAGPLTAWPESVAGLLREPGVAAGMAEIFPDGYYLDHASLSLATKGSCGIPLHGGGYQHDERQYYRWHAGRWQVGMCIAMIALTPVAAGMGGTALVPGSHKANLPPSPHLPEPDDYANHDWIASAPLEAGDVVVLSEALMHGAFPWKHDWDRRCVIAKFYPAHLANLNATIRADDKPFWV